MSNLSTLQKQSEDVGTRLSLIETALRNQEIPQTISTAAATITPGVEQVFLTYAGVSALTLANPVAGAPVVGGNGQDGTTLVITDTKGEAHTVTTGTNGINGAHHIATFSGTVASNATFKAFGGSWWIQASSGVTIS